MFIYIVFLFIFSQVQTKFLLNPQHSSIVVIRHIRLNTDDEHYRIRCPYHLKHLTLTLLNYSNEHCFSLYSKSLANFCPDFQSPCQFYGKSIPLECSSSSSLHSKQVDVTYQCSSNNSTFILDDEDSSTQPSLRHSLTYSYDIEEIMGIFILGLLIVVILWLTICCICFIRCRQYSYADTHFDSEDIIVGDLSKQTHTGGIENLCLHVNPFETKCLSL